MKPQVSSIVLFLTSIDLKFDLISCFLIVFFLALTFVKEEEEKKRKIAQHGDMHVYVAYIPITTTYARACMHTLQAVE
jgi:hypothetical protein